MYNGWKNYETWNVALWIDNDQGTYHEARSLAGEAWEEADDRRSPAARKQAATNDLADKLKGWVPEAFTDIRVCLSESGPGADLLQASLGEVDWHEIAEHFLDDIADEAESDEDEDEDDDESDDEDEGEEADA